MLTKDEVNRQLDLKIDSAIHGLEYVIRLLENKKNHTPENWELAKARTRTAIEIIKEVLKQRYPEYLARQAIVARGPQALQLQPAHWKTLNALENVSAFINLAKTNDTVPIDEEEALLMATHRRLDGGLYYRLCEIAHASSGELIAAYIRLWPPQPSGFGYSVETLEESVFEKLERSDGKVPQKLLSLNEINIFPPANYD